MDKASQIALGNEAPLFTTIDLKDFEIGLEDYRGSYVLVDFWASWCRACRVENPKFLTIYKEYKNQKFDIISISIDTDTDAWKNAIKKDKLPWSQILDADKSIYSLYLLSSLPSNFLLNQEGKIILGQVTVKGGDVFWNGSSMREADRNSIYMLCDEQRRVKRRPIVKR